MFKIKVNQLWLTSFFMLSLGTVSSHAEPSRAQLTLGSYGLPGVIEMPMALSMPDAELSFTTFAFKGTRRGTLTFQATPRLMLAFRYSNIEDFSADIPLLDRSVDVQWQFLQERHWWPAIAIGVRDIAGTGIYSGEYLVATRHFGANDEFVLTGGVGFGRLGERDGLSNPFGLSSRPVRDVGLGGQVDFAEFFRGDAAFFGGIEHRPTERIRFQLEYSSDRYSLESSKNLVDIVSPFNVGMTYKLGDVGTFGVQYLYGSTIGASFSFTNNPSRGAPDQTSFERPRPLGTPRVESEDTYYLSNVSDYQVSLRNNIEREFIKDERLNLLGLEIGESNAVIRVSNIGYGQEAQAFGRVVRILSNEMPKEITTFEVIFVVNGLDTSLLSVNRVEAEAIQTPSSLTPSLAGSKVLPVRTFSETSMIQVAGGRQNRLTYGVSPYIETFLFDPEAPIRGAIGAQFDTRYEFGSGFVGEAAVRLPVLSNLSDSRVVDGVRLNGPFPVRSELARYNEESTVRAERLTLSHYSNVSENVYTRINFGYLERMFAGVSSEVLWKPVDSNFGLGLELNQVWRRDFDGGFGLQDYSVSSGHVSAYFPIWDDFTGQIDVGRYLAGDYGATVRINREFDNGWRVGAFASLTDVSFADFGEGSFDKGIEIVVPTSWFTGTARRDNQSLTLRPVQRDGGARLDVQDRLYDIVTDYHQKNLERTQSLFWR